MRHPPSVVAFAILREASGDIVSFAAFRALRRVRHTYRFDALHRASWSGMPDALAAMRAFIPAGSLVIGEGAPGEGSRSLDEAEQHMLSALPMIEPHDPPGVTSFLLRNHEQRIEGLAEGFAIPLSDRDAPLVQQARRLADRAEALWVTFAATYLEQRDAAAVLAAYDAWRAIEAARPLPF